MLGDYYFVETKAPKGYALDESKIEFSIEAGKTNEAVNLEFTNEKNETEKVEEMKFKSVILTKVDNSDTRILLANAEFSLYKKDGTLIASNLVTNSDGQIHYQGLEVGEYYFVETKAPTGYVLDNQKNSFTIEETTVNPVNVVVRNRQEVVLPRLGNDVFNILTPMFVLLTSLGSSLIYLKRRV